MKIHVFGAVFLDMYIYGEKHNAEIIESVGGSGLNIALGLYSLGHDVELHGNIGDDARGRGVIAKLQEYGLPTNTIARRKGSTGLFIALNDTVLAVERGANDEPLCFNESFTLSQYAILTTELPKDTIEYLLSCSWKRVFLDVGPRPHLLKDLSLPENTLVIGTSEENEVIPCDIVKLGPKGACWGDITTKGNGKVLPHTVGAGDLFDTVLIDGILKGINDRDALEQAVKMAEESCNYPGGFCVPNEGRLQAIDKKSQLGKESNGLNSLEI